jgi:putative peptidoglycan lipid II flippase
LSRKAILKSSSTLVVFTMISRVLGLFREVVKAAFLGTTALSDAFTIAFLIPNLLRRLFAEGTISAAFIPTFKGYLNKGDKKETAQFLSAIFTFGITVFFGTVLAGMIFSGFLVDVFGPELSEEVAKEAVFLTRIMFPYLAFISIAALIQGILNSFGVFGPSGFTPILFNLSFITFAFVLSPYTANPARAIAIGVVTGGVVQALFQVPFMLKRGIWISLSGFKKAFFHPGVRKVLRLVAPTMLGMGAYQINIIVTTRIANSAGTGIVSSLQFSNRLEELILGIFVVSLSTVILPEFSADAKKGNWDGFNKNLIFGIKLTAMISIPATIFTLMMRHEIVTLLFKFGKFDDESVRLTSYALLFHICGLFFIAISRILFPAFFAQEDTVTPTVAGIISVVVNIVVALLLVESMKGGGVALASTISAAVSAFILIAMLTKSGKVKKDGIKDSAMYSLKLLFIAFLSILPIYFFKEFIYDIFREIMVLPGHFNRIVTELFPFVLSTFIFGGCLVALLIAIKDENTVYIFNKVAGRLKWKK